MRPRSRPYPGLQYGWPVPDQPSTARPRRGRLLRAGAAVAVLLGLAGYLLVQYEGGGRRAPRCTVVAGKGDGSTYEMTLQQASNAATISAVGTSRGLPERAVTIALATALQESALRNIDHGDRDSVGLFQQRPSQGWGSARQIMDPAYASGKFYEHLEKVPGYTRLPLTVAAQKVQRSGFPQAYAKHETDAALLAAALTGRAEASFRCAAKPDAEPGDPAKVRAALTRDFGPDVLPKTQPAGAESAADADAAANGGKADAGRRTVAVPVGSGAATGAGAADDPKRNARRGWELAHWAVAQSGVLGIERVSYAGFEWSAADADDAAAQWHKAEPVRSAGDAKAARDGQDGRGSRGGQGSQGARDGKDTNEVLIVTAQ
ncbi:heavy metal transporter [Streptomyces sp. NPDC002851]